MASLTINKAFPHSPCSVLGTRDAVFKGFLPKRLIGASLSVSTSSLSSTS